MNEEIGTSIFHGANTLHVQNDEQQEEEDLEDQRRRQAELQNLIANAFDDIGYEDETINSSCDESGSNSRYHSRSHISNGGCVDSNESLPNETDYKNTSFNSLEQLQVLYQIRVRENQNLLKHIDSLKVESKRERDVAKKKYILLEAEYDRSKISLEQSQHLLMEKSNELIHKTKEISDLKSTVQELTKSKEKNDEELLYWKTTADELQQRLSMVEKGLNTTISEKHIRSHYEQKINDLENNLDSCNNKLDRTEREFRNLQNNLKESEHLRDISLAEKGQIINTMTKNLEESQAHRHALLSKVSGLQIENQALLHEIRELKESIDKQLTQIPKDKGDDLVKKLRDELQRSLDAQIEKRTEIQRLEGIINEFNKQETILKEELKATKITEKRAMDNSKIIDELKKEKDDILIENAALKGKIFNLENDIKEIQSLDSQKSNSNSKNSDNQERISTYKEESNKLKSEIENLEQQVTELKYWKERYSSLEDQCLRLQETLVQLNSKYSECQVTVVQLKEQLSLKQERDEQVEILKQKAAMFEDFMKEPQLEKHLEDKSSNTEPFVQQINPDELIKIIETVELQTVERLKNIFDEKLNELQKTIETKNSQLNALTEENKNLKDKLLFDRDRLTELNNIWITETNIMKSTLQSLIDKNKGLTEGINKLTVENQENQLSRDILTTKLADLNQYVKKLKVQHKNYVERVRSEQEQQSKKFNECLTSVEKRVLKYLKSNTTDELNMFPYSNR